MKKFKYLTKDKISDLPETPGVYAFMKGRDFLYIGKAVNLKNRVKNHQGERALGLAEFMGYIETKSETDALILENELIKKYQPKYNTQWKDDKNYFYVGITKEAFPLVFITHQPRNEGSPTSFIGPFVNGGELKQKLKELRKTNPYRTCKTIPKKPCLWYHLNQCPAPCLPAVALNGQRLEAYDIADIQGKEATGSMVTFVNGKPDKNFYRKFKIKGAAEPNDVAMLKEILDRRLKHEEWPYPDIILIDGGKAQFNAALKIKNSLKIKNLKLQIMSLAKKHNELFIEGEKKPVLLENLPRETFNLILRARDEAHRFARAYHHKLRDKALLH
ncbi:MAG: GIY-YIG nuclease family protein [Candidatus Nealsonbacteria bacterium]|nr:GIY-YIG nuclease family protein [Candidatus Nealsonbacteria bacterium]